MGLLDLYEAFYTVPTLNISPKYIQFKFLFTCINRTLIRLGTQIQSVILPSVRAGWHPRHLSSFVMPGTQQYVCEDSEWKHLLGDRNWVRVVYTHLWRCFCIQLAITWLASKGHRLQGLPVCEDWNDGVTMTWWRLSSERKNSLNIFLF
jgi:hypothetical protein